MIYVIKKFQGGGLFGQICSTLICLGVLAGIGVGIWQLVVFIEDRKSPSNSTMIDFSQDFYVDQLNSVQNLAINCVMFVLLIILNMF